MTFRLEDARNKQTQAFLMVRLMKGHITDYYKMRRKTIFRDVDIIIIIGCSWAELMGTLMFDAHSSLLF